MVLNQYQLSRQEVTALGTFILQLGLLTRPFRSLALTNKRKPKRKTRESPVGGELLLSYAYRFQFGAGRHIGTKQTLKESTSFNKHVSVMQPE